MEDKAGCQRVNVNTNTVQQESSIMSAGKIGTGRNDRQKASVPHAIQFNRLTKDALASAINKAAAERVRRGSSGEREGETHCMSRSVKTLSTVWLCVCVLLIMCIYYILDYLPLNNEGECVCMATGLCQSYYTIIMHSNTDIS